MLHDFSRNEFSILYSLLTDNASDIILKTDRTGYLRHASPAIARLGFAMSDLLIPPHLLDLVDPAFSDTISSAHQVAVDGGASDWIEFRSAAKDKGRPWFAIRFAALRDPHGAVYGAVGIIRSIAETVALKEQLFRTELTDPLTGLTNRRAFMLMLEYLLELGGRGWLALFEIDHFKAINMRYGLATGDSILIAFADLLRSMTDADAIISRVGARRFGLLLPGLSRREAQDACMTIAETVADIGHGDGSAPIPLTTSAGATGFGRTIDATIRSAELSLFLAKAKGGNAVELARI